MTTFFVAPDGDDLLNGTSELTAWATIAKLTSSTFAAGDRRLLERGGHWRERLNEPSSGTSDSARISLEAYGVGPAPRLNANDIVSAGWTVETTYWYVARAAIPYSVVRNNKLLKNVATKVEAIAGCWWWDSVNLRVYVGDDPNGATMEMSARDGCIRTNGKSWLLYDGVELNGATSTVGALHIDAGSANGIVRNMTIRRTFSGVAASATAGNSWTFADSTVEDYYLMGLSSALSPTLTGWAYQRNTIRRVVEAPQLYGGLHPMGIFNATSGVLVEDNDISDIVATFAERFSVHGAYIQQSLNPIVRRNRFRRCHGYGFKFSECTGVSLAQHNICVDGGAGIGLLGTSNAHIYHNVMWNNVKGGLFGFGYGLHLVTIAGLHSTNAIVKNNIIGRNEHDGVGADQVRVEDANQSIAQSDHNIIWSHLAGDICFYQTAYRDWAEWKALGFDPDVVVDGETISLNADPQFVDWANGDFRLKRSSPARGAATWIPGINDAPDVRRTPHGGRVPTFRGGRADIGAIDRRALRRAA